MTPIFLIASALLASSSALAAPQACDDTIKTSFKPDSLTTVVAIKAYAKGDKVFVSDSPSPVTLSNDLCMVKLLVGPGNPGPADARSTSVGIGIEVWLPTHANWNNRIRDYGGGGSVGGNHIYADSVGQTKAKEVGSKFPALVIAGMGFASGTTDAGQRWSQNGSFRYLPDGKLNFTLLKDFSTRSLVQQAQKTRALAQHFYGKTPAFAYFDGHSTGGRQVWKIAQEYPELYDGYLTAAPAMSTGTFNASVFYPQLVMKANLGYTSVDPAFTASNFKQKMAETNKRAVAACDVEKLGFLLDPFACSYNPSKDPEALCTEAGGRNADAKTCLSRQEAEVINKIWYGATTDGSYDPNESAANRSGKALGKTSTGQQMWWTFPRGADWNGLIGRVGGTESIALALQDIRYATPGTNLINAGVTERDKWRELDFAGLVDVQRKSLALQSQIGDLNTDNADLSKLQKLGRKVITYTGLGEEVIPPATSVNHFERVAAGMGGVLEAQKFLRLYLVPAKAHSSQGRAYTVGGNNNTVPLPKLPGAGNQNPTREQDQMFSALQDWVEKGTAPNDITITSRDNSVSYPICVYPLKTTWNGKDSSKVASSYACK